MRLTTLLAVGTASFLVHATVPGLVAGPQVSAVTTAPGTADQDATAAPAATAPAARGASCADVLVVAVPGAGEGGPGDAGTTLAPLVTGIEAAVTSKGRTASVRVVAVTTQDPRVLRLDRRSSLPAEEAVGRKGWRTWSAGVTDLAARAQSAVDETVSACPDVLVAFAGYSQGADALHRLLLSSSADLRARTVAAVLVGDGARTPGSVAGLHGAPAASRQGSGVSFRKSRDPLADVPARGWSVQVQQVCLDGDVVCDLRGNRFVDAAAVHRSYDEGEAARLLADLGVRTGRRVSRWPVVADPDQVVSGRRGSLLQQAIGVRVARGFEDDVRFAATGGLPAGLALTPDGLLRGVPEEAGTFTLTFTMANTGKAAFSRPMPGSVAVEIAPELASAVSAGGAHSCAVRADGTLWCWGSNRYGQLGVGDRVDRVRPTQVGSASSWASVSAGGAHTCALRTNGVLKCWGLNWRGQLGLGGRKDKVRPATVGDLRWSQVSAGWTHTCGVTQEGEARCWGRNESGALGDGTRSQRLLPTAVSGDARWLAVAAGGWHTCGVRRDGALLCWGRNRSGELGDGSTALRDVPTRVGTASDWLAVSPSWTHTCGLRGGGQAYCWGANYEGELGTGALTASRTPTAVAGGLTWTGISTGVGFSCGTTAEEELWCWGGSRYGQLGYRSDALATSPVRRADAVAADAGWLHACGMQATGVPVCFGGNESAQLGDGTRGDRPVPQRITVGATS